MQPNSEKCCKYSQCNQIQKRAAKTHNATKFRKMLQILTMQTNTETCISSVFWVFAALFCIWLHCEYLQHFSVFGRIVRIFSVFLCFVVLWVFTACFCLHCKYVVKLMKMFSGGVFLSCIAMSSRLSVLVIWKHDWTYDQVWWPTLGICALHLSHPKCTHTAVNTHTPWTHTRSSGQPFMLRRPGSSWGFGALLKGTSVVVLRVERELYIHSPHLQFLPAQDSNSQPFDYKSDSLTIRPRLPQSNRYVFDWLHCSMLQRKLDSFPDIFIACAFVWGYLAPSSTPVQPGLRWHRDSMTDDMGGQLPLPPPNVAHGFD